MIAPRLRQPAAPTPCGRSSGREGSRCPAELGEPHPGARVPAVPDALGGRGRSFESMGPPFAVVPAVAPPPGTPVDPVTGELTVHSGMGRTIRPVVGRLVRARRRGPGGRARGPGGAGLVSPACEPVCHRATHRAPPCCAAVADADRDGRAGPGDHVDDRADASRSSAVISCRRRRGRPGVVDLAAMALEARGRWPVTEAIHPRHRPIPARCSSGASGRWALAPRPVVHPRRRERPVDVTVRLLDPAGRLGEQSITVPAGGVARRRT